ncbi:MAG TPA: hypothetical protein VND99_03810 [Candidatus Acidoferrales bacterium]|nr:hypothetical protein [Candidatus Acidoferrales bacterium]
MNKANNTYDLEIIAGPCSITPKNTEEIIDDIAAIRTPNGNRAIFGTRVVGLKSRTALDLEGEGMGIDSQAIQKAMILPPHERMQIKIPSVELAEKIVKETGMVITTEIMIPHIQLPYWESKKLFQGKLMVWNPAVNQLGWNIYEMGEFAQRNDWNIGIKHGKFLGKDPLEVANHPEYKGETSMEKVLVGLTSYVPEMKEELIIIHRGVDVPGRGDYRNAITHEIMKRIKKKIPKSNRLYFDPTHSIGPVMRHKIIDEIISAMQLRSGNEYLYDGILMEAGSSSPVDLGEHVTLAELKELVKDLSSFRVLRSPDTFPSYQYAL